MLQGSAVGAGRAELLAALDAARADIDVPFKLQVNCTTGEQKRSMDILRGRIAVWNRDRQIVLSDSERDKLIDILVDADFAGLEPRYGETPKADKQEAPLRVSCRVFLSLLGTEKTSVQVLDGEQSEHLLGLAGRLLDHVESLSARGVSAENLQDGLEKLADGVLAPEVLTLRLLRMSGPSEEQDGLILRIEGGVLSRQAYSPGQSVGEIRSRELRPEEMRLVVTALRDAGFSGWPLNLRADNLTELEVSLLGQRKTVSARSSFRPAPAETEGRFAGVVTQLEQL